MYVYVRNSLTWLLDLVLIDSNRPKMFVQAFAICSVSTYLGERLDKFLLQVTSTTFSE